MPQEALTPSGIQAKQTSLYALSNNALIVEANSIRNDFKAWLTVNFLFNAAQQTYLNGMDARWIAQAACRTGFAVENRLPVNFVAPIPLPPPSISKMVRFEDNIHVDFSQGAGFATTGALTFTLIY